MPGPGGGTVYDQLAYWKKEAYKPCPTCQLREKEAEEKRKEERTRAIVQEEVIRFLKACGYCA